MVIILLSILHTLRYEEYFFLYDYVPILGLRTTEINIDLAGKHLIIPLTFRKENHKFHFIL